MLNSKRYTTIAGGCVFFFVMSMVPLTFWLTLILGKLPVVLDAQISLPIVRSVEEIIDYIREEAARATTGASVFLALTTLYSSTNLFYQLRRSGEIIYGVKYESRGLITRLGALIVLLIVLLLSVVLVFGVVFLNFLFSKLLPSPAEIIADYLSILIGAFLLVLLLNAYVCPIKVKLKNLIFGTVFTLLAWVIASVGFAVYLKVCNVDRLYGALSTVIVFLLWLYVMMICFISGVIFNSERIENGNFVKEGLKSKEKLKK